MKGHAGAEVSKFARLNAFSHFEKLLNSISNSNNSDDKKKMTLSSDEVAKILTQSLLNLDQEISKIPQFHTQGATACVVYLHSENQGNQKGEDVSIITANIGDSRAVLSRNRIPFDLSQDHKPNSPSEKARVEALGGSIEWDGARYQNGQPIESSGVYRVNGNLALSRSIGNTIIITIIIKYNSN